MLFWSSVSDKEPFEVVASSSEGKIIFKFFKKAFPYYNGVTNQSLINYIDVSRTVKIAEDISPLLCYAEPLKEGNYGPSVTLDVNPTNDPELTTYVDISEMPSYWNEQETIDYTRLATGLWRALPRALHWVYNIVPVELFPHVSMHNPKMIAYCVPGKQIRTKLGKFLKKFSEIPLTDKIIQEASEDYNAVIQATFYDIEEGISVVKGTSREDFANAYNSGVSSCMTTHKLKAHGIEVHPAEVYASGDFAILTTVKEDSVTSRAIANERDKLFWSVYPKDSKGDPEGDGKILKSWMLRNGYKRSDEWAHDCKLILNYDDNCEAYPIPYIDCDGTIFRSDDIDEETLVINPGDNYSNLSEEWIEFCGCRDAYNYNFKADEYGNQSEITGVNCDHCEDYIDNEEDMHTVRDRYGSNIQVCEYCRDHYYVYIEGDGEYYPEDETEYSRYHEEYICTNDDNYRYIDSEASYVHIDELVECFDYEWELVSNSELLSDGSYASYELHNIVELHNGEYAEESKDPVVQLDTLACSSDLWAYESDLDLVVMYDGCFALESEDSDDFVRVYDVERNIHGNKLAFNHDPWLNNPKTPPFRTSEEAVNYVNKKFFRVFAYAG